MAFMCKQALKNGTVDVKAEREVDPKLSFKTFSAFLDIDLRWFSNAASPFMTVRRLLNLP
jgi:hypothetical protein